MKDSKLGGGTKGNKSVTGKYPHKISKAKSMIGTNAGNGRTKGGGKQRTMMAR